MYVFQKNVKITYQNLHSELFFYLKTFFYLYVFKFYLILCIEKVKQYISNNKKSSAITKKIQIIINKIKPILNIHLTNTKLRNYQKNKKFIFLDI